MKNPLLSCPYVVKKRKLCQNYNICSRKVNRMPFFPICNEKPSALMPILWQKRQFSKTHTALMPIFCQKTSTFSKIQVLSCYFIQILHSKPPVRMPILVQKLQFCQNYTILWLRKKIDFRRSGGEVLSICDSYWD